MRDQQYYGTDNKPFVLIKEEFVINTNEIEMYNHKSIPDKVIKQLKTSVTSSSDRIINEDITNELMKYVNDLEHPSTCQFNWDMQIYHNQLIRLSQDHYNEDVREERSIVREQRISNNKQVPRDLNVNSNINNNEYLLFDDNGDNNNDNFNDNNNDNDSENNNNSDSDNNNNIMLASSYTERRNLLDTSINFKVGRMVVCKAGITINKYNNIVK